MVYGKKQVQVQVAGETINEEDFVSPLGEFKQVNDHMKRFRINKYLAVVLDHNYAYIEVNGQEFHQCMYPVLTPYFFQENGRAYQTNDLDEASFNQRRKQENELTVDGQLYARYGTLDHPGWDQGERHFHDGILSPEERFWVICSSLQVWAENGYSTKFLHAQLAFPLARALADLGDVKAKNAYENEVLSRWKSGIDSVKNFLMQRNLIYDLSSKTMVKLQAYGMPSQSSRNFPRQIDERALVEAWREGKAELQYKMMKNLRSMIQRASSRNQALMLVKARSAKIAGEFLDLVNWKRFTPMDMQMIEKSKRAKKAIEKRQ